jgi:type IV pilus modification protein PilV
MSRKFAFARTRGFSLIEVLVAVTILSIGLIALATLQIALVRSTASSKSQSQGLALAKDKLEELRTYSSLAGYQSIDSGNDTPAVGSVQYTRAWTVTRYVYNQDVDADGTLNEANDQRFESVGTITGATPTNPTGLVANNEFKVIRVVSNWTESSGETASVALVDATGAISPSDSALINKLTLATSARKIPVIINNPAADTMVIPIAIGNGTNSAATNPKPQVVIGTSTVETQFDVLTYGALSGDTAVATQRVETIMVGCTCDIAEAPASTVRGKRPTYWDGSRYVVPVAATVAPIASADTQSATLQSPRCDLCCRDHQDPVGTTGALFSPLWATRVNGTVTAAHPHYFDKTSNTPATSGTYKEACRLIRIDGQWRVAADMYNDYFALLATGNGTTAATPVPDSTSVAGTLGLVGSVARYQQFVLDYLTGRFVTPTPSAGTAMATYNTVNTGGSTPVTLAAGQKYVLDNPASVNIPGNETAGKWLHSRGMYVDYLEQDAVNAITDAKADSACTVNSTALNACILKLLPFTSINLTEIADWTPLSGVLSVTNYDYSTSLASGNPVRARVTTNASAAATITASSLARPSNTGLLDLSFDSISPVDDIKLSDTQAFSIVAPFVGSSSGNGTSGTLPVTVAGFGTQTPYVSSYVAIPAAASTVSCGLASPYLCNLTDGMNVNGGMYLDVGGYNHQQTAATTTVLTGCIASGNAAGGLTKPSTTESYTGSVCKNYQVTNVTTTSPNAGTINWASLAPYSLPDGRVTPLPPGEVTRITFSGKIASSQPWAANTNYAVGDVVTTTSPARTRQATVAHNSGATFSATNWTTITDISLAITLGLQGTTAQTASSCSYTCGNGNAGNGTTGSGANLTCASNKFNFTAVYPACP